MKPFFAHLTPQTECKAEMPLHRKTCDLDDYGVPCEHGRYREGDNSSDEYAGQEHYADDGEAKLAVFTSQGKIERTWWSQEGSGIMVMQTRAEGYTKADRGARRRVGPDRRREPHNYEN